MNKININTENDEYQIICSLKLNREKRSKLKEIFIEGTEYITEDLTQRQIHQWLRVRLISYSKLIWAWQ